MAGRKRNTSRRSKSASSRGSKSRPLKNPRQSKPLTGKEKYDRRVERALAKGKTRQQARGHKPKEHVERREREIEEGKITWSQNKAIDKFYARFNPKGDKDSPTLDRLKEWAGEVGYNQFIKYRATWDGIRKQYLEAQGKGTWVEMDWEVFETMFPDLEIDDADWLFYH